MTIQFWIGFLLGVCLNAALVIAFTPLQDRAEKRAVKMEEA